MTFMKENHSTSRWFIMVRETQTFTDTRSLTRPQLSKCFIFPSPDPEFQKFLQRKAHCMGNFDKPVVMKVSAEGNGYRRRAFTILQPVPDPEPR